MPTRIIVICCLFLLSACANNASSYKKPKRKKKKCDCPTFSQLEKTPQDPFLAVTDNDLIPIFAI